MTVPADFAQANALMLQTYAAISSAATTPAELEQVEQLTAIMAGLVQPEKVSEFFEFGYAKAETFSAPIQAAFADVGEFATRAGFYGLAQNGRGTAMQQVLRGEALPEGVEPPVPSDKYVGIPAQLGQLLG